MELTEIQKPPDDMPPSWAVWIQTHLRELFNSLRQLLIGIYVDEDGVTYIGDGGVANYTKIDTDGEVTLHGTARAYYHREIDAGQFTKIAGGSPPGISNQGTFDVLLFDSVGTEEAFYNYHLSEDWATGTDITVRIYWTPTTNAVGKHVQWEIDWEARATAAAAAGELLGAGSTNVELHDDTYAGAWNLQKTSEGTISGASLVAGDVIGIKLSRKIEAADDYDGADAAFVHLEIKHMRDRFGEAT